jgi:2-polyprenyl-3-methyl-5-hydroxy-6-metoxy-1,4-benzoquinol methylase
MSEEQPDIEEQRRSWDAWIERHASVRRIPDAITRLRMTIACEAIRPLAVRPLRIIEVGCGSGDMCHALSVFGQVTGVDLAPKAIAEAQSRYAEVTFAAGDFLELPLPVGTFDVAVSNSVLAHVADQAGFCRRVRELLRPDGTFVLLTQNRFVYERRDDNIMPDGVLRRWVDKHELRALLAPLFRDVRISTHVPSGNLGILRWLNSAKVNKPFTALLGVARVTRLKEQLGFGQELVAVCRV